MPSEAAPRRDPWIASQGLGMLCGQATVLLLAVGSVVLARTKDGVSADIQMDDIRPFFDPFSAWHAWFYALLGVLALYGVNTAWCTTLSVVRRWRAGQRRATAYAGALMHVGFLIGLIAHLVGGLGGVERGQVLVAGELAPLGPGWPGLARLVDLEVDHHPDGSPRTVLARVELRDGDRVHEQKLAFNRPLTRAGGADLLLLQSHGTTGAAVITAGDERCVVVQRQRCRLAGTEVVVHRLLLDGGHWGAEPVAVVNGTVFLVQGRPTRVDGADERLTLEAVREQPYVVLRSRHSPGAPLALLMVAVFCLGMTLMGRRWL